MTAKIIIYNKENSLTVHVDELKENDLGKEVDECINRFEKYYGKFDCIKVLAVC